MSSVCGLVLVINIIISKVIIVLFNLKHAIDFNGYDNYNINNNNYITLHFTVWLLTEFSSVVQVGTRFLRLGLAEMSS